MHLSQSLNHESMTSDIFIVIELVAMTMMLPTLLAAMFCAAEAIAGVQFKGGHSKSAGVLIT